jgi:hypothetical protein
MARIKNTIEVCDGLERIKDIDFLRLMLNEEIDDVVRRTIQNSIRRMELTAERDKDAEQKR